MKRDVYIGPDAEADLLGIWHYVFELGEAKDRADRAIRRLNTMFEQIAEFPSLGTLSPRWGPNVHAFQKDNYLVVYRVHPDKVEILRVSGADPELWDLL
ncbi:MAG: toxin ParE1/3/4 [Bradymonadia bacterium]